MNKEIEAPKIKKEIDDFDLGSVGISHDFDDQLDEEQIFKTIKLGKPDADDWFKLFPPEPGKLGSFIVGVVSKIKDAKNHKREFLIGGSAAFKAEALKRLKPCSKAIVAYGVTSTRTPFIWCINFNDDYPNKWHKTARDAALQACHSWTKIQSSQPNEQNNVFLAAKQENFPKIDIKKYPVYKEAIKTAFEGRLIKDKEHYAYQKSVGDIA